MQKRLGIPNDAHWALATLTTPAMPDELVAMALSYDTSTRYGVQSPTYSGVGDHFVGGEWRADTTHNTLMAISNGGTRARDALLTLYHNNGREKYEMGAGPPFPIAICPEVAPSFRRFLAKGGLSASAAHPYAPACATLHAGPSPRR